jgi:UDP-glucose 4-epimerase
MKILVTGGSGLLGRYVVDKLCKSHTVDVVDLNPPHRKDVRHFAVDVLNPSELQQIVRGYDAVVHLAGIPHPLNDPPERVFRVNTLGTFNVLEASSNGGIDRLIFMSSESTLGLAFSTTRLAPVYLPIDENHVLRPQDPYGLSKVACEMLCRGFSDRTGITTICLRAPWIWIPENKERLMYRLLIDEYPKWYKNLWAYIHVQDVAQAIEMSLTAKLKQKHDSFFIAAAENWTGKESKVLAKQFFPETREFKPEFSGVSSFISSNKASVTFGFSPSYSTLDIFA